MSQRPYHWEKRFDDKEELEKLIKIRERFEELNKPILKWHAAQLYQNPCPHPREHAVISEIEIICGVCAVVLLRSMPEFSKEEYLSMMRKLKEESDIAHKKIEELRASCPHIYDASPDEEFCCICEIDWEDIASHSNPSLSPA